MYDELVLLELKEFGGRHLVSVENDMQKDAAEQQDAVIGTNISIFDFLESLVQSGFFKNFVNKKFWRPSMRSRTVFDYERDGCGFDSHQGK